MYVHEHKQHHNVVNPRKSKSTFQHKLKVSGCTNNHAYSLCVCVHLCATCRLLGIPRLALVWHTGSLLLAELDVSVSCALIKSALTIRTLDIVCEHKG